MNDIEVEVEERFTNAVIQNNFGLVKEMLESGAIRSTTLALFDAAEHGNEKMINFLLEKTPKEEVEGYFDTEFSPLYAAVKNNNLNIVSLLIDYGYNVHSDQDLALAVAAKTGSIKMIRFLVEQLHLSDYRYDRLLGYSNNHLAKIIADRKGFHDISVYLEKKFPLISTKENKNALKGVLLCHGHFDKSPNEQFPNFPFKDVDWLMVDIRSDGEPDIVGDLRSKNTLGRIGPSKYDVVFPVNCTYYTEPEWVSEVIGAGRVLLKKGGSLFMQSFSQVFSIKEIENISRAYDFSTYKIVGKDVLLIV